MPLHVIIDGYNVMKAQPKTGAVKFPTFQAEREAFIDRMVGYNMGTINHVTVVFDGKGDDTLPQAVNVKGVRVIYSSRGETADEIIVRLVRQSSRPKELLVVSSDRQVQSAAKAQGATVANASHLLDKMTNMPAVPAVMEAAEVFERQVKGFQGEEEPAKKKGNANRAKKDKSRNKLWVSK